MLTFWQGLHRWCAYMHRQWANVQWRTHSWHCGIRIRKEKRRKICTMLNVWKDCKQGHHRGCSSSCQCCSCHHHCSLCCWCWAGAATVAPAALAMVNVAACVGLSMHRTSWHLHLYASIISRKWLYIHPYHTVDSFWGSYTVWCLPLAFWTFFHFFTFKLNAMSIPFTNMGECELIYFSAYLLATP
jgi:hypothetical protein